MWESSQATHNIRILLFAFIHTNFLSQDFGLPGVTYTPLAMPFLSGTPLLTFGWNQTGSLCRRQSFSPVACSPCHDHTVLTLGTLGLSHDEGFGNGIFGTHHSGSLCGTPSHPMLILNYGMPRKPAGQGHKESSTTTWQRGGVILENCRGFWGRKDWQGQHHLVGGCQGYRTSKMHRMAPQGIPSCILHDF